MMKKFIVVALVAAVTVNPVGAAAEELVLYDAPVVVPDQVGEAYLDREPELVIYDDQLADTAPLVALDQVGEAYLDTGTIPMAEALAQVSAENAVDLGLWADFDGEDVLVSSGGSADYDPQTQGMSNSRRWRLMEGYSVPIITTYSTSYGWRDLAYVGAPSSNGYAGSSNRTLELDRGYYGGSQWMISEARRNYEFLWGTDISRRGMDWLPILGGETYLDLAWATAAARDLAMKACSLLDDLYALDEQAGLFRNESLLAQTLVDEFVRVTDKLSRALTLREQVISFARAILASGGVNNPIENGRPYGGVAWDFQALFGESTNKAEMDDFIVQRFGWDCIPRAYENMPWYYPAPVPTSAPVVTPAVVTPAEPTPAPVPVVSPEESFDSVLTLWEEPALSSEEPGFTDGQLIPIEEGIIVLDEAPWDEELSLDEEEIIFLD